MVGKKNFGVNVDMNKQELQNAKIHNLTTAQIATLATILVSNDKGLIVYDTTILKLLVWNGAIFLNLTDIIDNSITNAKLAQMPANTVKVNNTNALANGIDYNLPIGTVLGNVNGNIEGIVLEETINIKRTLVAGVYVYSNPLLTVNSGCLGWSWTETTGHTSVPLSCVPANGSMTFTTGQIGDTAEFLAFIKFNIL